MCVSVTHARENTWQEAGNTEPPPQTAEPNTLQALLALCSEILTPPPPKQEADLTQIVALLEQVTAEDVGAAALLGSMPGSAADDAAATIRFCDLYDSDAYSVVAFALPPKACLPMHSHPNITILSRVVRGSVQVSTCARAPPAFASIHACMHPNIRTHMHASKHTYTHACMHASKHAYTHTGVHLRTRPAGRERWRWGGFFSGADGREHQGHTKDAVQAGRA